MEGLVLAWLLLSVVVAFFGDGREIGFGKALLVSLLLSPLIGSIFVATSPTIKRPATLPPKEIELIRSGNSKSSARTSESPLLMSSIFSGGKVAGRLIV